MARIKTDYIYCGDYLCYEIIEDGYLIYVGEDSKIPIIDQGEPFIPYPKPEDDTSELSNYEYSCLKQIDKLCNPDPIVEQPTMEERIDSVETQVTEIQEGMCEVYELVLSTTA